MNTQTIDGTAWTHAMQESRERRKQKRDLRAAHFAEVQERMDGNRRKVFEAIQEVTDATGSEIAERIGWPVTSVRPRLVELRDREQIEPTGERRMNKSGSGEYVYRAISREIQREFVL